MYKHEISEKPTALYDAYCQGFGSEPSRLLQAEMEKIAENMRDLPFYRSQIHCFCPKAVLFENQWITTVVTPWMLSLVILPGPEQQWETREIGDKLTVAMPYKHFTFTVSGTDGIPQYLSCSLHSPPDSALTDLQARQLAKDCLTMVLSLPLKQAAPSPANGQPDERRRRIFKTVFGNNQ